MKQEKGFYRLPAGGRNTAIGIWSGGVFAVVVGLFLVVWFATQWVAWKLGFQHALDPEIWLTLPEATRVFARTGSQGLFLAGLAFVVIPALRRFSVPLLVLALFSGCLGVGPLYVPLGYFVWLIKYGSLDHVAPIFEKGHWIIGIPSHLMFLVSFAFTYFRARKIGGAADTHGSADFASEAEVDESGFLGGEGIYLGGWSDGRKVHYLKDDGPSHIFLFAPSRSGKGVCVVIPTALSWENSLLVFDPKGELWHYTSRYRKEALDNVCIRFDPTCTDGTAAGFNPLMEVRKGELEVRDVQQISDVLTNSEDSVEDPHWRATAADLLAATILHVLWSSPRKDLAAVLHLLSDPRRPIDATLTSMLSCRHDPEFGQGWVDAMSGQPTQTHPVVAAAARTMLNRSENERGSVLSTAIRCLSLWRDPVVARNTANSDVAIEELVYGKKPVSLYLTIPASDLSRTRPLTRMFFALALRKLTERLDFGEKDASRRRLLLLLDEFPALGPLREVESALPYIAGFGLKALIVVQDITQIHKHFGRNQGIVGNCDTLMTFATRNIDTAKLISEMCGSRTVHKETRTYTGNRLSLWLGHVMASEQESQRALLTPDEVMRLPADASLVFAGSRPIRGVKTPFYQDGVFKDRAALAPLEESDRIPSLVASSWPILSLEELEPKDSGEGEGSGSVDEEELALLVGELEQELEEEPVPEDDESSALN